MFKKHESEVHAFASVRVGVPGTQLYKLTSIAHHTVPLRQLSFLSDETLIQTLTSGLKTRLRLSMVLYTADGWLGVVGLVSAERSSLQGFETQLTGQQCAPFIPEIKHDRLRKNTKIVLHVIYQKFNLIRRQDEKKKLQNCDWLPFCVCRLIKLLWRRTFVERSQNQDQAQQTDKTPVRHATTCHRYYVE